MKYFLSNVCISWMHRYHFYDLKVHFWWPNKRFFSHISSLNTLYKRPKEFVLLSPGLSNTLVVPNLVVLGLVQFILHQSLEHLSNQATPTLNQFRHSFVLLSFCNYQLKCISKKSGLMTCLKTILNCFSLEHSASKTKHLKMS